MKQRGKRTTAHIISPLGWMGTVVATVITLFYGIEYIRMDTLSVYDAAGHLQAVNGMMQTWPALASWQPETLLGWAQGTLYPPLVHWTAAGLGLLIGANAALKTLVILALLATPLTLWLWLRSMKLDPILRWPALIGSLVLLSLLPAHLGGSVSGLFDLGMITSFVSLPLVFATFALAHIVYESKQKRWFILLGILFGLLIWAHVVGAIAGGLYLLVTFGYAAIKRNAQALFRLLYGAAIAFIVAAPFIFTFLLHLGRTMGNASAMSSDVTYTGATLIAATSILVYLFIAKRPFPSIALGTGLALIAIATIDIVTHHAHPYDSGVSAFYLYRLEPFMILLVGIGALAALQSTLKINVRFKHRLELAVAVICILVALPLLVKNPTMPTQPIVTLYDMDAVDGRFIETFYRTEAGSAPYTFQTQLLRNNPDAMWANGLFIESEPNAPFIKSLSVSINPMSALNEQEIHCRPEQVIVAQERRQQLLDYFGIRYTVSLNDNRTNADGTWVYDGTTKYYHVNDRGSRPLAEVSPFALEPITGNWETAVLDWWEREGPVQRLLYNAANGEIAGSTQPTDVKVTKWNHSGISIAVNSEVDTVILIKASYSSKWRATDVDGKPVRLYRAAPNMILLSGHGIINLTR